MSMNAAFILKGLEDVARNSNTVYVPEFTWDDLRLDAIIVDTKQRLIRGFEIKVSRGDYFGDRKWQLYSQFCSSLTIVCPDGLIHSDEVPKPFGLAWAQPNGEFHYQRGAKQFNKRDLAWTWTYLRVLEMEFPRLVAEARDARLRQVAEEVS